MRVGLAISLMLSASVAHANAAHRVRVRAAVAASVLRWSRCAGDRTVQCARLVVPADYKKPNGSTISVAVARVPALDPKQRIGSLLVNPGGPGASGVSFTGQFAAAIQGSDLRSRFDIVSFDPRGVGGTTPVRCLRSGKDYDRLYAVDPSPDTPAKINTLVNETKSYDAACQSNAGDLLRHVSTADVVQDMDRLRSALGEEQISYLGFSYGTYLGAKYADAFPSRVRAFVLDGALDPTLSADERARGQGIGFENALTQFLRDCANGACGFVRTGEQPLAAYDRMFNAIETTPMRVGDRLLGPGEAATGVLAALYNKQIGWPTLRGALTRLDKGDGRGLLALFDLYADRQANGSYLNTADANAATNCTDVASPRDPAAFEQLAKELETKAPHFGRFAAYSGIVCAFWPVPVTGSAAPVKATGSAPILVIGTTSDPATPYPWAQSLAKQLQNSVLLTHEGEGHTAFLTGNACIRRAAERYLIERTPPAVGTRCKAE